MTNFPRGNAPSDRARIVESVVADIALRRSVPDVFLLNEAGRPTAWPIRSRSTLPPSLQALVDMYFAQHAAHRVALTELVDVDGVKMTVRIVPYHEDTPGRYAMIVEPFVLRARHIHGSGELTTTS